MAEKKSASTTEPSKNLMIIGLVLIACGLAWSLWSWNPGLILRAETEQEAKERKDAAKEAAEMAKIKAKQKNKLRR